MVLVVDDSQEVCDILQRMLEQNGLSVLCAHDTYEAETLMKDVKPSVIVLDDSMPGRSGLEWLRQLKSQPLQSSIPVLMFSASTDVTRADQARDIGASDWFAKGITEWSELISKVSKLHNACQ